VKKIFVIAISLIFLVPLAECTLPFVLPKQTDYELARINSPDGKWSAITQDEEYASSFSTPSYAVVIQPQTGWFRYLREKKVFEISQESATVPPTVKWDDSTHLVIEGYGLKRDITLQIPEYEPIRLTYKIE